MCSGQHSYLRLVAQDYVTFLEIFRVSLKANHQGCLSHVCRSAGKTERRDALNAPARCALERDSTYRSNVAMYLVHSTMLSSWAQQLEHLLTIPVTSLHVACPQVPAVISKG